MKSEKGFTLVELLATVSILGIIMLIAVPNILGTVERNKKTTYIEDAKKMVSLAEYKMRGNSKIKKPTTGCGIIYTLDELDNGDLSDPPEGGKYSGNQSFVVITFSGGQYKYRVQLYEEVTKGSNNITRGIPLRDSNELTNEKVKIQNSGFTTNSLSLVSNNPCTDEY